MINMEVDRKRVSVTLYQNVQRDPRASISPLPDNFC